MEFCKEYASCTDLDGRLLITRTIDGPGIWSGSDMALGRFPLSRAMIRPYVKLTFEQKWYPKEICYGPVSRIFGLAPCEEITTEMRTVQHHEFTQLVQKAMESSEVSTNTRLEGREFIDTDWDGNTVDLSKMTVGEWGSFWEVAGAVVGGVLGGPIGAGAGAWIGGAIDDAVSGGGDGGGGATTVTGKVLSVITETLESVQKSQSQSLLSETTSFSSTTRERSITRRFKNPYKNRTLELRFIPAFRHYEVVTYLYRFDYGLSLDVGNIVFPRTGLGVTNGDFLQARLKDQRIMSVANAELGLDDEISASVRKSPTSDHLNANPEVYTKKLLRHMHKGRDEDTLHQPLMSAIRQGSRNDKEAEGLIKSLAWSNMYTKDKSIFVPMTDAALAVDKLNLNQRAAAEFSGKLKKLKPEILRRVTSRRDVHLFSGTHLEAVPGKCILPDLANDCDCKKCDSDSSPEDS